MSLSATIRISPETRDALNSMKRGVESHNALIRRLMREAEGEMDPNKLCPKGWAWLIGSCDFGQDCLRCTEVLAPILSLRDIEAVKPDEA